MTNRLKLKIQKDEKKILIAGGGYADIPLIKAAKSLGFYVITSGNRPEELGHTFSDEYHAEDFSDKEAMLALANRLKVGAICPCCNDFSALTCAYVAENLQLPGYDSYKSSLVLHHKDLYRKFAIENSIPSPKAVGTENEQEAIKALDTFLFPIIIKPVDLTGGKGIQRVDSRTQAIIALKDAFYRSKAKRVVLEEFLSGSHHGFTAILRSKKIAFYFADNEIYYLNKYMVSGANTPTLAPNSTINELIFQTEKIATLLQLKDGIFHVQFILRDNKPVIVEICRRPPGDLYVNLVKYATGVDYPKWIVKTFAGLGCEELNHSSVKGYYLRHCVMSDRAGTVTDVVFSPQIQHKIIDSMMWWKKGDQIEDIMTQKLGIVFLRFDSKEQMLELSSKMQSLIKPIIK